jgi:hypothetical protein
VPQDTVRRFSALHIARLPLRFISGMDGFGTLGEESRPRIPGTGSQHQGEQFQGLLAEQGIVCSMSRSGDVWDNAAMESFFAALKKERVAHKVYRTRRGKGGCVRLHRTLLQHPLPSFHPGLPQPGAVREGQLHLQGGEISLRYCPPNRVHSKQ